MKRIWRENWPYFLLVPFVLGAVVGLFVLPAELSIRTESISQIPRLMGILVPVALAALGSSQVCFPGKRRTAGAIILVLAAVLMIMLFVWNL